MKPHILQRIQEAINRLEWVLDYIDISITGENDINYVLELLKELEEIFE